MDRLLLLGDEAIGQGALDAGISGIYAYPGTPSTEITEYVQQQVRSAGENIHCEWSANEKTAMEEALGMSYAGKRAMVCMKHVGVNVAADGFVNAAITGVNGGLIITVADDPSMHSSQNEQDSRFYGKFAMIPVYEPSNQQEAYDMVHEGFDLSERTGLPVMMRITTRLAHSRTGIVRKPRRNENELKLPDDPRQFVLLPAIARKRFKHLLDIQNEISREALESQYNEYFDGSHKKLGIIAAGLGYNYLRENLAQDECSYPVLKISHYPVSHEMLRPLLEECETILVIEDGFPFIEEQINGLYGDKPVKGRLDGTFPRDGEMNPDLVRKALQLPVIETENVPENVTGRPPAMCKGCSHIDMYEALIEALKEYGEGRVFSDIGCYTLGALPPYNAINTCVDMGASVTMAKGAADAGLVPAVSVIGDSTFTHSGITGLLDAVNEDSPITIIISDNSTTGMTGGQPSPGTGKLEEICKGMGIPDEHVITINPLKKEKENNIRVMAKEFAYQGVSVIIAQRECIQTAARRKRDQKK